MSPAPSPRRDPGEHLPLTAPMFHVMAVLAEGEQHGYGIIKAVGGRSGDSVKLSTGTLYGIIKRLLNDGMIVESTRRPAPARDDERRRYYRLTDFGRAVAAAEAERLQRMVAVARAASLLRTPGRS